MEWLEAHYADLCLVDVRMPLMNGLELAERVKERYPWMKCVVISSYEDFQYAKKAIEVGAIDYILQPVQPAVFQQTMGRCLISTERPEESRVGKEGGKTW